MNDTVASDVRRTMCLCGCGETTSIIKSSQASKGLVRGEHHRFINGHAKSYYATYPIRPNQPGYLREYSPGHPRAQRGYVLQHVLVAERALGKILPEGAEIHHVDECKYNNEPANLVVCQDSAYHHLLHKRMRAYAACGNASAERCVVCHRYDNQGDISVPPSRAAYHRSCAATYQRGRRPS